METLIDNCILGITANRERCRALVESSAALATALCPALGYKKSAEIAKKCNRTGIPVRQIVLEEGLLPEEELESLFKSGGYDPGGPSGGLQIIKLLKQQKTRYWGYLVFSMCIKGG